MILAEAVMMWVLVVFAVGFVGFFAILLLALGKLVGFAFRSVTGVLRPRRAPSPLPASGPRVCTNGYCGHLNAPRARYCGRCGQPMGNGRNQRHG